MFKPFAAGVVALTAWMVGGPLALDDDAPPTVPAESYDWILREKIRGGYQGASGNAREVVAKMKSVGMNAVMPKFNEFGFPPHEKNLEIFQRWGDAAHEFGIHFFPVINFRGQGSEKLINDRREVASNGQRMEKTPCPLDEAFWATYIFDRTVELASRSKELHITGILIDPEMYGSDHTIYQTPCYCDDCLRDFLQESGTPLPDAIPAPAARVGWLKDNKLSQAYEDHFIARVRGFCEKVERAAHQRNPDLLLGVLLLDYNYPFMHGMAQGLGTPRNPVLALSETTYGTGYTEYVPQRQKTFADASSHVLLVPGLWLMKFPIENLAEQCYGCAQHSAGYWLYTIYSLTADPNKMPANTKLPEPVDRYWAAAKEANSELDLWIASGGKYESALKVRPFEPFVSPAEFGDIRPSELVRVGEPKPLSLGPEEVSRLRGRNPLYILARAGDPVEVKVTNLPLSNYRPGTRYSVFDAHGKQIADGAVKVGEDATVKWTPERDGIYLLIANSESNGYSLQVLTKQPFGFLATSKQPLTVNSRLGRLYFFVPKGVDLVRVGALAKGQSAGRGGKLAIITPDGQIAAKLEGELGPESEVSVSIPPQGQGRVWALTATDVTNDLHVYFPADSVSLLGTDPTRLLGPK